MRSHRARSVVAILLVTISLVATATHPALAHHTEKPHSWYVWDVAIDPVRPSTVYAMTDHGVYKSTDGAGTWVRKVSGLATLLTKSLGIARDGTLYLGASTGLFKSVNGGDSWTHLKSACTDRDGCPDTWSLVVAPDNPRVVYAGTRRGVLRTVDGGATWQSGAGFPPELALSLAIHPSSPTTVFASGPHGVFKSTDGGQTWVSSSIGITLKPGHSVKALAIDPRNANVLVAGLTEGGIYRTTDGGTTWSFLAHPCDGRVYYCDNHIEAIEHDPVNPDTLYVGTLYGALFKSVDGGKTWSLRGSGINGGWVKALAADRTRPTVYAGTYGGGVFRSTDGGATWNAANRGLS